MSGTSLGGARSVDGGDGVTGEDKGRVRMKGKGGSWGREGKLGNGKVGA